MTKYNTKLKTKVVKEYLEDGTSYIALAKKYNIKDKKSIRVWVNAYQTLGYEGLKVLKKSEYKNYTLEFKLKVVNLYLTGKKSYQSLANEFKMNNPSLIGRWVKDFKEKGIDGLKPKKQERSSKMPKKDKVKKKKTKEKLSELEKLKEENYWLKLENAVIKKKIQFSQMTEEEIRQYLKSLDH